MLGITYVLLGVHKYNNNKNIIKQLYYELSLYSIEIIEYRLVITN